MTEAAVIIGASVLLVLVLAASLIVVLLRDRRAVAGGFSAAADANAGRIRVTYVSAAAVGIVFAFWAYAMLPTAFVNATNTPGLLAALGPSLAGIVYVAAAMLGEITWPSPTGASRAAYLTPRPAFAQPARRAFGALWLWAALLILTLVVFGFLGASDGRSIPLNTTDPRIGGAAGPFPGWAYGVPMLAGAALLFAATLVALHLISRRPAVPGASARYDLYLRARSATNLVKGVQLALAASCAGALFFGGNAASTSEWPWGAWAMIASPVVLCLSILALTIPVGTTAEHAGAPSPAEILR